MKEYERTFQQWKELAARYFEAETTDAEEEALARFLVTPAAQGKEFDELRAVMGYVATGRAVHRKQRTRSIRLRYYAAAAAGCSHSGDGNRLAVDGKGERMRGLHQRRTLYRQGNRIGRGPEIGTKGTPRFPRRNPSGAVIGYLPDAGGRRICIS